MSTMDQAGDTLSPAGSVAGGELWSSTQDSAEFATLRRRLYRFVFPVSAIFLGWYLLYVLLADYAHDFMALRLAGNITVGLVLGLLQFVSTFVITALYVRFASLRLDPMAERIRKRVEGAGGAVGAVGVGGVGGVGEAGGIKEPGEQGEPRGADQ